MYVLVVYSGKIGSDRLLFGKENHVQRQEKQGRRAGRSRDETSLKKPEAGRNPEQIQVQYESFSMLRLMKTRPSQDDYQAKINFRNEIEL